MAKSTKQSEKRKKIILAALFAGLALVMVINFMSGGKPTTQQQPQTARQPLTPGQKSPAGQQARRPATDQEKEAMINQMLADSSALNLRLASHSGSGEDFTKHRNIFAYRPPPPPKVEPPPPPPPITINPPHMETSVVAGAPFKVAVYVVGTGFPPDATIYFDGRAKPTTGQGSQRLTTQLEPGEYTSARSISVEVKSQSNPAKSYSNVQSITIPDLPTPQLNYHGYHSSPKGAAIEFAGTPSKVYRVNDTIQGQWKIISITETSLELEHIRYQVKRRIPIKNRPQ